MAVPELYWWVRTMGASTINYPDGLRVYSEWVLRDPDDGSPLAYMFMEDEREPAPASYETVERFRRYANEVLELEGEA